MFRRTRCFGFACFVVAIATSTLPLKGAIAQTFLDRSVFDRTNKLPWGVPAWPYSQGIEVGDKISGITSDTVVLDRQALDLQAGFGKPTDPNDTPSPEKMLFISLWGSNSQGCYAEGIIQYAPAGGTINYRDITPTLMELRVNNRPVRITLQPQAKPAESSQAYTYLEPQTSGTTIPRQRTWYTARHLFLINGEIVSALLKAPAEPVLGRVTFAGGREILITLPTQTVQQWKFAFRSNPSCTFIARRPTTPSPRAVPTPPRTQATTTPPAPAPIARTTTPPPPTPPLGSSRFSDTANHWAGIYIQKLVDQGIMTGFSDGTFRPDSPVTRAQYAAIVVKAFNPTQENRFSGFWDLLSLQGTPVYDTIIQAIRGDFLAGFQDKTFRPNNAITRAQVLASLVQGLKVDQGTPANPSVLSIYDDVREIPTETVEAIAHATTQQLVINYPNVRRLEPKRPITRGELAALLYQALVLKGQAAAIPSPYLVHLGNGTGNQVLTP